MNHKAKKQEDGRVKADEARKLLDAAYAEFHSSLVSEYKEITGKDWCVEKSNEIGYHAHMIEKKST